MVRKWPNVGGELVLGSCLDVLCAFPPQVEVAREGEKPDKFWLRFEFSLFGALEWRELDGVFYTKDGGEDGGFARMEL